MEELNGWSVQKERINQLYNVEEKTLSEVRAIMEEQFGHKGSLKQYKDRLKAWGFDKKNIKDADMRVMLRKQLKRKIDDGKETEFFLNEKQVPPVKMNRFVKRKKLDDDIIAAADMPTPSYITCQTPEPTADIEGTSRDIEAISHDMQVMMTIPEDDEVHNQTESDDVDSKLNNKSIISSSREVLEGPLQNTVDVDSDIPGTKEEQQEYAARMAHLILHSDRSDLETILQDEPAELLFNNRSDPRYNSILSVFVSRGRRDGAYPVVPQILELALLFLFHLRKRVHKIVPSFSKKSFEAYSEYGLFTAAQCLSAYVLFSGDSAWQFDRFSEVKVNSRYLSKDLLQDMNCTIVAAHKGEWDTWRQSLRKLQTHLPPGRYTEDNTPFRTSDLKNIPFGPQAPLRSEYITELLKEDTKTSYSLIDVNAFLDLTDHTNNVLPEQQSETRPAHSFFNYILNKNLEQGTETSLEPPLETISARYHLSNSPTWYYRDIERSNLLHHLSPALFNSQSPYTAIYKAQYPQYQFRMANSPQLARLLETPPMSTFPY